MLKEKNIKTYLTNNFKPMNKTELIEAIAQDAEISKTDAKKALESVIFHITETLKADGKVALVGFGTFSVAERAARQGINPATKQPIEIAAKRVAKFKAGSELSEAISIENQKDAKKASAKKK